MEILETERLVLRELTQDDAEFIRELVNDPAWLCNIGDRGVRDPDDARRYIEDGPVASYREFGFGLWAVDLKELGTPVGISGLIQREYLDFPDIGFAFLPNHRGRGYALESASAVMGYARGALGITRVLAIVTPGNTDSIRLLERLGMEIERDLELETGDRVLVYRIG